MLQVTEFYSGELQTPGHQSAPIYTMSYELHYVEYRLTSKSANREWRRLSLQDVSLGVIVAPLAVGFYTFCADHRDGSERVWRWGRGARSNNSAATTRSALQSPGTDNPLARPLGIAVPPGLVVLPASNPRNVP